VCVFLFMAQILRTQLSALPGSELVYPVRVNEVGHFLSHDVSHHLRRLHRRDLGPDHLQPPLLYRLRHSGRDLSFNLTVNRALLAPGFVAERRYGGIKGASISPLRLNTCHFIGRVTDQEQHSGVAAISTCHGMKGVFRLWGEDHFIEPWLEQALEGGSPQPHLIYKRHAPGRSHGTCGQEHSEKQREKWEKRQRRRRRIKQRSVSKEKWVETLVVADSKMVEHHGNESIEAYVLTVMNMVAGLFRDASIGNSINIVIVRLVLLEEDEEDLKITHHADNTLMNFCKWQKKMNIKGEAHPTHHDVAILLTRKDICAGMNRPCETLGLSHVSGMCQPHRSCNINEDSGLPLAFTVAHELGHNFGIQHDGTGNACEPIGKRPFIMSPQLLYDTSPLTWSRCSQEYITRFLDRGWGLCLDDLPAKEAMELPSVPPGVLYDVNHQCRLQYGARSGFCDDMDNVCNTLWCTVGSTCHSKLDAAVDGTKCSEDKWCFNGNCISTVQRPKSTDGSWGAWSSWAECTRTCSAGIQSAERHCNNPTPKYGGRYCLGERKRFRICNIKACVTETPSFRHIQCSQFDSMPYKGKLHKWIPVLNRINPCELHCRPVDGYFSEKMLDAVIDGTPCNEGNTSRDICINGICKNVGCDYEIDSNALEDRCGVCQGDSSTCETVKKTFDESEGLGYVDIGLIPQGAREIRIEEVAEAGNFLALRSDDPEKYFLNGDWIIQWNGDYKVAGTTFTYERNGNLENLTSPGPTKEPVWIQLLFQETNPGVRFEYTIRRDLDSDNEIQPPEFFWRYGLWTECTATCGGGFQKQIVHCLERIAGIVEEQYCDPATRPDDRRRRCHEEPCPARWWVGEWQACSTSCGHTGVMKRTALCIQSIGLDEQRALPISECQHMPRPDTASTCNTNIPCPSDWVVGNWSQCSASCGEGTQKRAVRCAHNTAAPCSPEARPPGKAMCAPRPCPAPRPGQDPALPEWSGSGASAKELFNEVGFNLNFGPRLPPDGGGMDNHIVEGDYTVDGGGQGGKGPSKTNVFVDDFYYDYNFINFHEDLAYDDGDEVVTGGEDGQAGGQPEEGVSLGDGNSNDVSNYVSEESEEIPGRVSPSPSAHTDHHDAPGSETLSRSAKPWSGTDRSPDLSVTIHRDGDSSPIAPIVPFAVSPAVSHPETVTLSPAATAPPVIFALPSAWGPSVQTRVSTATAQEPRSTRNTQEVSPSSVTLTVPPSPRPVFSAGDISPKPTSSPPAKRTPASLPSTSISVPPGQAPSLWPTEGSRHMVASDFTELKPEHGHNRGTETTGVRDQGDVAPVPTKHPAPGGFRSPITTALAHPTIPTGSVKDPLTSPVPPTSTESTAYWVAGNWSECSTTCGMGAVWRAVQCSTGSEADCDRAQRPAPARRCYLRPCSAWRLGNWTKCSKNCGVGVKLRDVQCINIRDRRPLRPFHCQPVLHKPPTRLVCSSKQCMDWYISSWGDCSQGCDGGEQERLVLCPEVNHCDRATRPNKTRTCNPQPCTKWMMGSWGQCTVTCGGGIQRRLVKCVNTVTGLSEEDNSRCDHEPWPENSQKCNLQDCSYVCDRDRLTFSFCQTLRMLGRCYLHTVRAQCCQTCRPPAHATRDRGNERVARR
uniref:ADAM metallopeptidase with thrombospondin type 1 motif 7 n=1 Tax=Callorhinchus milii TaxID=7868 RepID=A0A4W3JXF6_CALMI